MSRNAPRPHDRPSLHPVQFDPGRVSHTVRSVFVTKNAVGFRCNFVEFFIGIFLKPLKAWVS